MFECHLYNNLNTSDIGGNSMAYTTEYLVERGMEPLLRWMVFVAKNDGHITYGEVKRRLEPIVDLWSFADRI